MSSDEDEEEVQKEEVTTEEVSTQSNSDRGSRGYRRNFRSQGNRNWRRRRHYRNRGGYNNREDYIKMKIDEAISNALISKYRFAREDY
jgi:hypothetical protein